MWSKCQNLKASIVKVKVYNLVLGASDLQQNCYFFTSHDLCYSPKQVGIFLFRFSSNAAEESASEREAGYVVLSCSELY